jgi:hypothetical protein
MKKKLLCLLSLFSLLLTAGCTDLHPASFSSVSKESVSTVTVKDEAPEPEPEPVIEKKVLLPIPSVLPEGGWQINTLSPDWYGYVDDTLAMNSMISFKTYEGQGKIYLSPAESVTDFTVYVNETKIDTSDCVGGGCYVADISDIVHTGRNTVQITGISPRKDSAKVRVSMP